MVKFRLLLAFILLLTLVILSFSIQVEVINANSVLFQDDFNDGINLSNWQIKNFSSNEEGSAAPVSELSISTSSGTMKISGTGTIDLYLIDGVNVGWIGKSLMLNKSLPDEGILILETEINIESASETGYLSAATIEFDPDNRIVIFIGKHAWDNTRVAGMIFDENDNIICVSCFAPFNYNFGEFNKIRLVFDYNTKLVQLFINDTLYIEDIYNGSTSTPKVGLASLVRLIDSYIDSRFDNFKITSQSNSTSMSIPYLKQYSSPWGTLEYDSASHWYPNNPSISRWGCALTAATMILNYHAGHDDINNLLFSPEDLNNWLDINYGYSRNGAVIWPAVTLYSKENPGVPTVEFQYEDYHFNSTKSELENNFPPLIKLKNMLSGGNHFIVATGIEDGDITINDPATTENITLSQANSYWGDSFKIGKFTPSNTDLSYIVLFINKNFDIKVSRPSGQVVNESFYFEEGPMLDPTNPNNPSEIEVLKAFYYPKPEIGTYQLVISGNGIYQLDSYLFTRDGRLYNNSYKGLVRKNRTDQLSINIEEIPKINQKPTFTTLLDDLEIAYQNGYIKRKSFYRVISYLLFNAKRLYDRGFTEFSQRILKHTEYLLLQYSPRFIDVEVSQILRISIDSIINLM